jgi:hypothetical protein
MKEKVFRKTCIPVFLFCIAFLMNVTPVYSQFPCVYLQDFVPDATDPVLEVRVKVFIFKPSTGVGVWDNVTQSDIKLMLDVANDTYSTIPAATLNVGAPLISHARIQFVLYGIHTFVDDQAYLNATWHIREPLSTLQDI